MQMEYEIMQTQIRLLLQEQSDLDLHYLLKHIHPTIDILNCSVRSCTYNIVLTCMCFIITCPMIIFVLNRSAWKMALEDARAMNPNVAQPGQQVIYPHTLHGGYAGDVLVNGGQYGEFF